MSKYRFKTEEEFKTEGLWNKNRPVKWVSVMNKYLGQDIPDKYNQACDKQEEFRYDQWHIEPHDYILKETSFVFPSKWCIKVDRNCQPEEVYKWRKISWVDAGYICQDKHWNHRVFSSHTEITLEQFKQHVLKESPVVETTKEMFYEGDYIVTLDVADGQSCAKRNYCFKQRINCTGIAPAVDLKGSTSNSHGVMSFGKKEWLKDWRYATPEEAAEYERIGKPYDVTTLQTIPEYIECTSSKDSEPYFIKGNVYKVVKASPISSAELKCNILKDYEEHNILYTRLVDTDGTKLFKPSTKEAYEAQNASVKTEYIPQVGDYVVMENAGGWGYHPDNNGCIAIVEKVSTNEVGFGSDSIRVTSIGGQIINAKKTGDVIFTNVPIIGHEKQTVFRKALLHEIPNTTSKVKPQLWMADPIVEQRINTPSIKKETFIDNVQSVDVVLRTKKKSIKF